MRLSVDTQGVSTDRLMSLHAKGRKEINMKKFVVFGDFYPVEILAESEQEALQEAERYAASMGSWNWDMKEVKD